MKKVGAFFEAAIPLLAVVGILAALVMLGGKVFGGDGGSEGDSSAIASLGPPESSWVPRQPGLTEFREFMTLWGRGVQLARARLAARELELKEMERRKREEREKADADARRRYEEAKRRAERAYKRALRRAAAERRRQEAMLAKKRREYRDALRAHEKAREVDPGEECGFENVRERFDCEKGRLPDPPKKKK